MNGDQKKDTVFPAQSQEQMEPALICVWTLTVARIPGLPPVHLILRDVQLHRHVLLPNFNCTSTVVRGLTSNNFFVIFFVLYINFKLSDDFLKKKIKISTPNGEN
jgi:hypothetical protein